MHNLNYLFWSQHLPLGMRKAAFYTQQRLGSSAAETAMAKTARESFSCACGSLSSNFSLFGFLSRLMKKSRQFWMLASSKVMIKFSAHDF